MNEVALILFLVGILVVAAYFIGRLMGAVKTNKKWEEYLPKAREDAIKRSRSVLGGQFSEQLAPYLPDFPYSPNEVRFLGKPIDFLVFKGMDERNITEIAFVEVKSGKSKLSPVERQLRDAIQNRKITWEEYRIPEEITRGEEK